MKCLSLFAALIAFVLVGCTGAPESRSISSLAQPPVPNSTTTTVVEAPTRVKPPAPATIKVPTDLVGKTVGRAKKELAKAGFTHLVIAGGSGITDSSKVAAVSHEGEKIKASTKIVLTGAAEYSRAACLRDETQCYVDGKQCATGSCVNAARGLTPGQVRSQTDEWLARHPGYCAVGETGAVAPCSGAADGGKSTESDSDLRDANGETYAEYCSRTGQPIKSCQAG